MTHLQYCTTALVYIGKDVWSLVNMWAIQEYYKVRYRIQSQHETPGDTERRPRTEVTSKTVSLSLSVYFYTLISYPESTSICGLACPNSPPLRYLLLVYYSPVLQKGVPTSWCRRKSQISQCFPKEAQHSNPCRPLSPPLLLWCQRNGTQFQKSSCQPKCTGSFLHTGSESLHIFVLYILYIKPAGAGQHLASPHPTPPPFSLSDCLHLEVVEWHQWRTDSHPRMYSLCKPQTITASLNTPWFCFTWPVDNKELVAVKGLRSSCLFLILFDSFVCHWSENLWEVSGSSRDHVCSEATIYTWKSAVLRVQSVILP